MSAEAEIALERSLAVTGVGVAEASTGCVPVVDLTKDDATDLIWEAATSVGFFVVTGHGIDKQLIESAFSAATEFFHQDVKDKETQSQFDPAENAGYEHFRQVRPSTGTVDQKESIQVTAREGTMDSRWPTHPPNFKEVSEELARAAHRLAERLLDMLEPKACPQVEKGTLSSSVSLWGKNGQCTLRLLHYPALEPETVEHLSKLSAQGEQHWRAGPHTDWCSLTLLFQRQGESGLECAPNPRAQGSANKQWLRVDPILGGIAVNIGDMLSRWSDGRLLSNLHRVRLPLGSEECFRSRYSIAFFAQADRDRLIECTHHEPITAGDYIKWRAKSNYALAVST